jgi:DNA polymerase III subunit epsilon
MAASRLNVATERDLWKKGAMNDSTTISETTITVLDYESTGSVRGYPNEPWQIGMVALIGGRVAADTQFESLLRVDPNRPFNPHAPGRHALLRREIAEAPAMLELWPDLQPRLMGRPLCAHNVATEKKFTREAAPMHRFGPWMDTLKVARKAWPGLSSYALSDLIAALGLTSAIDTLCPGRSAHDALYDAVASAMLLQYLLEQPSWRSVTVAELSAM